jgi:hypothetical protein
VVRIEKSLQLRISLQFRIEAWVGLRFDIHVHLADDYGMPGIGESVKKGFRLAQQTQFGLRHHKVGGVDQRKFRVFRKVVDRVLVATLGAEPLNGVV